MCGWTATSREAACLSLAWRVRLGALRHQRKGREPDACEQPVFLGSGCTLNFRCMGRMLLSDKDRHVKAKAAGALQSLAVDEDNQKKIKSLGAIPLITKLLSSRTPEVQSNAAGALHNLAVNDEEAQEAVATAGAIPPLISLMQNASPDLQAKAAGRFVQRSMHMRRQYWRTPLAGFSTLCLPALRRPLLPLWC